VRARFALALLVACRSHAEPAAVDAAASVVAPVVSAPKPATPSARDAMKAWQAAQAARDGVALGKVYADRVTYYGVELGRDECVKRASAFFAKAPVQTFAKLEVSTHGDRAEATVEKTVTLATAATYVQHLELALERGAWLVTRETDETTEKNLAAASQSSCKRALRAITDAEMGDAKVDEVIVSIADKTDVTYWGSIDTGAGSTMPHATSFHVDLAAGSATRDRTNRAGETVGSDAVTVDAAKMSAARAACKR
jgi:hypothetical protein